MEKKYQVEPDFIDFIKAERNAISKEMLNDEWWLGIPPAKRVVIENILIAYDQMAGIIVRNYEVEHRDQMQRINDFNITDIDAPVFTHTREFEAHFSYIKGKLIDFLK